MIREFHIENFRGLRHLDAKGFKRFNLIAGKNNTGKTALLEAIFLCLNPGTASKLLPGAFRPLEGDDPVEAYWNWLHYNRACEVSLVVSAKGDGNVSRKVALFKGASGNEFGRGTTRSLGDLTLWIDSIGSRDVDPQQISYPDVRVFSTIPTSPRQNADSYSMLVRKRGGEQRLEDLLRSIEPNLIKVRALPVNGSLSLYADIGLDEMLPLTQTGQGFSRLLNLYGELIAGEKNTFLVDEIENGIHTTILPDMWRGLTALAAQEDVQLFATTHSWECIRAAHLHFAETLEYDFALHRLDRTKEGVKLVTYDREMLESALQAELEVR